MSLRKWASSFPLYGMVQGFAQEILTSILKTGPIPQHVAFIMDGNRRFAKNNGLELGEGHVAGFESLSKVSAQLSKMSYFLTVLDSRGFVRRWRQGRHGLRLFH